ncbi:MAG TPA: inorganic diphosphatase [Candidatus Cybelea sp.]|jgi:inorganic pyrophosphatase|nr:inorganic diphosphatase [Candidatus Cybelea sp.]
MSKAVNPTNYDMIPTMVPKEKDLVFAVIETPAGTRHKYAFEPEYGIMLLKMTLAEGLMWPYDYGFIPQTLGDDGDPIDLLVLNDAPTFSGCLVEARLIGGILLKKNGVTNNRLVACPRREKGVALRSDAYEKIDDLPKETLEGIERFLVEYSAVEGNKITFEGKCSRKNAYKLVESAHKAFAKKQRK